MQKSTSPRFQLPSFPGGFIGVFTIGYNFHDQEHFLANYAAFLSLVCVAEELRGLTPHS